MFERFGKAEKLLMRVRSLKWHATTIQSAQTDDVTRDSVAAIAVELDGLETLARATATEEALDRAEAQADALARRLSTLGLM